ncbi:MAG: tetratricopeptide repeat protein [bacterium]
MTFHKAVRRPEAGFSFLGEKTRLEGTLRFSGRMFLNGSFRGDIEGEGRLELGGEARTEGRIRAENLVHRGESRGDLLVKDRLELGAGSFHRGNVRAKRVRINPKARLDGALHMPEARLERLRSPAPRRMLRRAAVALFALAVAGGATSALSGVSSRYVRAVAGHLERFWEGRPLLWGAFPSREGAGLAADRRQEALLAEAVQLEREGALPPAVERLEQAVQIGGRREAQVRFRLARALARLRRDGEAIVHLERLLDTAPGHIEGAILLGDIHARGGRLQKAAGAYAEALRRDPEDVVLRRRLNSVKARLVGTAPEGKGPSPFPASFLPEAERLLAEKRLTQAASLLQERIARAPENAHLRYQLGAALVAMGDHEEAIKEYRKVVELAPDWLDAYVRLGTLLEARGRGREAIALYKRAARLDSSNVDMLVRVAQVHKRHGRRSVARKMLLELREGHPGSLAVLVELGNLLWEGGKSEEAKKIFEEVLTRNPDSAAALNRLAWFHAMRRENLDQGIDLSRQSLELRPDTPPYLDTLAELYYRNKQPVKAIPFIQRAIVLDPNNRYYRLQLEKFKRASR